MSVANGTSLSGHAGAYAYRALRSDGALDTGNVDASSADDARALLARRGLLAVELRVVVRHVAPRASISAGDLALGLRMLADLLEAGLPMTRALSAFGEMAPAGWRLAVPHLQESVREGHGLAAAFDSAPIEIPALVVGIASAGEAGAGLAVAIRRAAELTESTAAVRSAVRSALVYPLVLAAAGSASIGLMIGVVLPRFAAILADLGQALPPTTRMVIDVATAARASLLPALGVFVIAGIVLRAWTASPLGRRHWHQLLLGVPVVGTVRAAAATAHSAFSLAALLDAGVPMRQALTFAARAAGDAEIEARLLAARDRIVAGQRVADAFRETAAFTTTALRLVSAGDASGRLATMLAHAAKLEQERSDRVTRAAVRLLEPALILAFAAIVGLVSAALLQAVYSVRPSV